MPSFPLQIAQKFVFLLKLASFCLKHGPHKSEPCSISHCHFGLWPMSPISLPHTAQTSASSSCLSMNSLVFSTWQSPHRRPSIPHSSAGLYLWRPSSLPHTAQFAICFLPKMCKQGYLPERVQKRMSALEPSIKLSNCVSYKYSTKLL